MSFSTGKRIKDRRVQLKIGVQEMADRLGKNRATVYRYESDQIDDMPSTVLQHIADVLGTTPAYLMGFTDDPTNHAGETKDPSSEEDGLTDKQRQLIKLVSDLPDEVVSMLLSAAKAYIDNQQPRDDP